MPAWLGSSQSLLGYRLQFLSVSSLGGKGQEALSGQLYKAKNPRAPLARFKHLPTAPPSNTLTAGMRFQHKNFVGDTNVHFDDRLQNLTFSSQICITLAIPPLLQASFFLTVKWT